MGIEERVHVDLKPRLDEEKANSILLDIFGKFVLDQVSERTMEKLSDEARTYLDDCIINAEDNSYDIYIGTGLTDQIVDDLKKDESRCFVVTDSNIVETDHFQRFLMELDKQKVDYVTRAFPAGESNKNVNMWDAINQELATNKFTRDATLVVYAGGVYGDEVGFNAATYKRGVKRFIQIPTSIVAMVDSGVGGKTGFDLPQGKNLVGAFYQPSVVWADMLTLETLPEEEYVGGLAEVVKYGIIYDKEFFEYLENHVSEILDRDSYVLSYVIGRCCAIKAEVVEKDPKENGLRRILNGGHTGGHAVEHEKNAIYAEQESDEIYHHGYGVSVGLNIMGNIAIEMETGYTQEDLTRANKLSSDFGLPILIPSDVSNEAIKERMIDDKKSKYNPETGETEPMFVLASGLGEMCEFGGEHRTQVRNEIVLKSLNKCRFF